MARRKTIVGVLALQGDVEEHCAALERAGAHVRAIKQRSDLAGVDALVIPGGESTTVAKLAQRCGVGDEIVDRVRAGMPLWGTCMGMIVAAKHVVDTDQPTLGLLDITVRRNAFGRQNESAEVELNVPAIGGTPFPAVFIRAPWIEKIGPQVELLASRDGHGVMVREGNVLATSFHPELTGDERIHAYFLSMVDNLLGKRSTAA
ncbi:MAG: pyridoxal 5'-phosphate synthase glutaminase subunit PdxT [Candidatus Tyrphobacter sp.]